LVETVTKRQHIVCKKKNEKKYKKSKNKG